MKGRALVFQISVLVCLHELSRASWTIPQSESSLALLNPNPATNVELSGRIFSRCISLRGGSSTIPKEHRLFVANLPQTLKEEDLKKAFQAFGKLTECKILIDIETGQSRRMGYVAYTSARAAQDAIDEMDEEEVCAASVCTKISVTEAKPPKQTW